MSYDENDAALDDFYQQVGEELYPEHKAQAIQEFTAERLKSFYVGQPKVMLPAVLAFREAKKLHSLEHYAAAVVFSVTAIEVFLKATLLKPVVFGFVHHETLATVVVEHTLGQTGFDRYKNLLSSLFSSIAEVDLGAVKREGVESSLLDEVLSLQKLRNKVIHQGHQCSKVEADNALEISAAVYENIVLPMLGALGLQVVEKGVINAV
jgi:hypothetical protein